MSDVIRIRKIHERLIKEYYDLIIEFYGSSWSLLPEKDDYSDIIRFALRDAISYIQEINKKS